MSTLEKSLQQLRDIHLPAPVSWWPLAPGWYVLLFLIAVVFAYVIYFYYLRWRKALAKRAALHYLERLQQAYNPHSAQMVIGQLSMLLRRVAIAKFPRQEVAGLKGNAWLNFLDTTSEQAQFSQGVGKLLITAPYTKEIPRESAQLFPLVKHWIELNI